MAIGSNHVVQSCVADVGDTSGFIPELWSQEVLKAYKANLVLQSWTQDTISISTPFDERTWIDGS